MEEGFLGLEVKCGFGDLVEVRRELVCLFGLLVL